MEPHKLFFIGCILQTVNTKRGRECTGKVLLPNLLSREASMAGFPFESLRGDMKEDQVDTLSTFTESRLPNNSQTGL